VEPAGVAYQQALAGVELDDMQVLADRGAEQRDDGGGVGGEGGQVVETEPDARPGGPAVSQTGPWYPLAVPKQADRGADSATSAAERCRARVAVMLAASASSVFPPLLAGCWQVSMSRPGGSGRLVPSVCGISVPRWRAWRGR
jgi:hypothetical protein